MDPQEPQDSPSPDTGKSDTETLGSATPSQNTLSPFNPLPETEALVLPEWGRNQEAVSWFLKLRKALRSIIYRYCGAIQKALHIFEDNDATRYAHYESLSRFLRELWVRWKEFSDQKCITTTFLTSSVIYDDFVQPISWMTTPRNAPHRLAKMAQLRKTTRQVAIELYSNRGLIQDAMARLEESNNGHHVAPFCGLPTPSLPSESEDIDSDEEVITFGGIRDHNLLEENGFDPIWIQGFGYPGTPPPELQEYLSSESTRVCDMIGSIRSIFWLFGRKDLVQVVDDPACVLKDEIIDVPRGINPVAYLMNYYSVEKKIPFYIQGLYDGV